MGGPEFEPGSRTSKPSRAQASSDPTHNFSGPKADNHLRATLGSESQLEGSHGLPGNAWRERSSLRVDVGGPLSLYLPAPGPGR
jgi:hypothetical protein